MSPKQKRALAALIVAAIAGAAAALAPGVHCDPPPAQTIEDLIPGEPSGLTDVQDASGRSGGSSGPESPPQPAGAGSSSEGGADSGSTSSG